MTPPEDFLGHVTGDDDLPPLREKLRILHMHTLPVISGSGIAVFQTMKGLKSPDVELALACAPGGPLENLFRGASLRYIPIKNFVSEVSLFKDLHALWQCYQLLKKERFHIVHTHNSKAGVIGRLAARAAGVPIIVHTVRGFSFHNKVSWFYRQLFIFLERRAARWCDMIIFISQPLMDWAHRLKVPGRTPNLKIYSGIDIEAFQQPVDSSAVRQSVGLADQDLVIGIVAKLWKGKGHQILIDAFANLVRAHPTVPLKLLVVGSGPLQETLRGQVHRLGLESQVVFAGFRSAIAAITAVLDISVLPSDFEGMGRVVLEAMAAGKPAVGSNVGGIRELVDDGATGLLVPPGNRVKLERALDRLIGDPGLRARLGAAGRKKLTSAFSLDTMVRRTAACYRSLLLKNKNTRQFANHRIGSFEVCSLETTYRRDGVTA